MATLPLLIAGLLLQNGGASAAPLAAPLHFAKARLLTSGFGAEPRVPLVADLDGDGFGDLIAIDLAAGVVDVARSVRGGKFLGPVNAASGVGVIARASARRNADAKPPRDELLLELADGKRKIVAFGDDSKWSVRDEPPPAPAAESSAAAAAGADRPSAPATTAGERVIRGDFDGDGVDDEIVGTQLRLAADRDHPQEVPLLASLPPGAIVVAGDVSGDHRADLVAFRRDDAWRVGRDVSAYVSHRDGDADCDGDGLDAATEQRWKSDPLCGDTDNDGLLDGWEVKGESALDLPALGASPVHKDCFVYVQRYSETDGAACAHEMARVVKTWAELPCANPDGANGIALHPIWLPPLKPGTPGRAWWDLGNENLPKTARGLAHYMEINGGGGGQAAELGDMGGCGAGAFWACFLHEFGHQVGLSHAGGPLPGACPTYTSLMSYSYSYGFNDDGNQIHYSHGEFAGLTLNESHLVERLPFPYEKVKFLEKGPYRFKLQADGDSTKIDWNRNGVFDDGVVRADIDDVYGVGTRRFGVGKTVFAPVLVDHGGKLLLFGVTRDQRSFVRQVDGVGQSQPEIFLDALHASGDSAAVDAAGTLVLFVPTEAGLVCVAGGEPAQLAAATPAAIPDSGGLAVSAASFQGRALALLWKDANTPVTFVARNDDGSFTPVRPLADLRSSFPPAASEDPVSHELVVVVGAKRGKPGALHDAWVVLRLKSDASGGFEISGSPEGRAAGGDGAGWTGNSRPVLLIEHGPGAVAEGRIHIVSKGFAGPPNFNCCTYEAITIGDATQNEGWRLRRYCDEWSTTKSPAAACFHGDDMVVAYRWFGNVHGDEDDDLHVLWNAYGISDADMHDFDDVSEIAEIGLARSILWRDPAAK